MKYLMLIPIVLLASCTMFAPQTTENIAKAIDAYCLTGDEMLRASMRNDINAMTQLGDIKVTCVGDVE